MNGLVAYGDHRRGHRTLPTGLGGKDYKVFAPTEIFDYSSSSETYGPPFSQLRLSHMPSAITNRPSVILRALGGVRNTESKSGQRDPFSHFLFTYFFTDPPSREERRARSWIDARDARFQPASSTSKRIQVGERGARAGLSGIVVARVKHPFPERELLPFGPAFSKKEVFPFLEKKQHISCFLIKSLSTQLELYPYP